MNKDTIKELSERLNELPEVLQEAILAPELAERIQDAGSANGLSEQKIREIEDEVVFVLLAYREYPEFPTRILTLLENQVEIARKVTIAVTERVFTPEVRAMLDAIYTERNKLETEKNVLQNQVTVSNPPAPPTAPTSTETKGKLAYTIPSYQKPLMGVPRYQDIPVQAPTPSATPTIPTSSPLPPSQPPVPPHM